MALYFYCSYHFSHYNITKTMSLYQFLLSMCFAVLVGIALVIVSAFHRLYFLLSIYGSSFTTWQPKILSSNNSVYPAAPQNTTFACQFPIFTMWQLRILVSIVNFKFSSCGNSISWSRHQICDTSSFYITILDRFLCI